MLSNVPSLDSLVLINPRFKKVDQPAMNWRISQLQVRHASITPVVLETLGKLPTNLALLDCRIKLQRGGPFSMPETQSIVVVNSDLKNADLNHLIKTPKLVEIDLQTTQVSDRGAESYSLNRPDVVFTLR